MSGIFQSASHSHLPGPSRRFPQRPCFPGRSRASQHVALLHPVSLHPRSREGPHMKLSYAKIVTPMVALAIALGVGACSRAQHITGAVTGPGRGGAGSEISSGCPTLIANDMNSAFDVLTEMGSVAQFRSNRIRVESSGDATELQL